MSSLVDIHATRVFVQCKAMMLFAYLAPFSLLFPSIVYLYDARENRLCHLARARRSNISPENRLYGLYTFDLQD